MSSIRDFFQRNRKFVLGILFMLVMTIITFKVLFSNVNFDELKNTLLHFDKTYLIIALLFVVGFISSEGLSFMVMGRALGVRIPFLSSFTYACVDVYFSYITPSATGGQPMMIYYMAKDRISVAKSGIMVFMYTLFYTLALLVLTVWAFFWRTDYILHMNVSFKILFAIGTLVCIGLMVICFFAMTSQRLARRVCTFFVRILHRMHIIKDREKTLANLEIHLKEYHDGAVFLKQHPFYCFIAFLFLLFQRIFQFAIVYMVYFGLGLSGHSFFYIIAVQSVLTISSYMIPLPGSVGASEYMFKVMYRKIFGEMLMPGLLLSRGISFYICLIFCGIVTCAKHIRVLKTAARDKKEEKKKVTSDEVK